METLQNLLPGASGFRGKQKEVIDRILNKQDVLAIMPTGGGKSVCYQVPAKHLPGITLVISPLLALMREQTQKLLDKGLPAACLSSAFIMDCEDFPDPESKDAAPKAASKSFRQRRNRIFQDAIDGKYKFLYVTPERLSSGSFIRFAQRAKISMIAVDEAHCISLWGYEFRPRYLEIARLLKRIGHHPVIAAFTATASESVREDIKKLLKMNNDCPDIVDAKDRPELSFSVRHMPPAEKRKDNPAQRILRCSNTCGSIGRTAALFTVPRWLTLTGFINI